MKHEPDFPFTKSQSRFAPLPGMPPCLLPRPWTAEQTKGCWPQAWDGNSGSRLAAIMLEVGHSGSFPCLRQDAPRWLIHSADWNPTVTTPQIAKNPEGPQALSITFSITLLRNSSFSLRIEILGNNPQTSNRATHMSGTDLVTAPMST